MHSYLLLKRKFEANTDTCVSMHETVRDMIASVAGLGFG